MKPTPQRALGRFLFIMFVWWAATCLPTAHGETPTVGRTAQRKANPPVVSAIPANDNFVNAFVLTGGRVISTTASNTEATREPNEPSNGNRTLWWKWTAPNLGNAEVKISAGGDVNTMLAVFELRSTTVSVGNLKYVSQGSGYYYPEYDYVFDAECRFHPVAGRDYYISLGDSVAHGGNLHLQLSTPAANDNFEAAQDLGTNGTQTLQTDNFAATLQNGEPTAYPNSYSSLWWKWRSVTDGTLEVIDTAGSAIDTVLEVYTGNSLTNLTLVRHSNEAADDHSGRVAFLPAANTDYYIRVASVYDAPEGAITLRLKNNLAPTTAADHVLWARAYLEVPGGALEQADDQLNQALNLSPDDPQANLLKSLTTLALLQHAPAYAQLTTQLGATNVTTDPRAVKFTIPQDANGIPIPASDATSAQAVDYIQQQIAPLLPGIDARLAKINDMNFLLTLSDSETLQRFVKIDYGDVQLLRAAVQGIEAATYFSETYDLAVSLAAVANQARSNSLDLHHFKQRYGNVLKFRGTDRRQDMAAALKLVNQNYQRGSAFVRNQRANPLDGHFLFSLPRKTSQEAYLRSHMQNASDSLDGEIAWNGHERERVNLSKLITTATSLHDMLGSFAGNSIIANTTPDPTFSGTLPRYDQTRLNTVLNEHGLLYDISTYFLWTQQFLPGSSPADQAPGANPAGDGLNNTLKFAFGLDPNQPASPSEYITQNFVPDPVDHKLYLTVQFVRRIDTAVVTYVVAVSNDLKTWDRTQAQVEQVGTPVPNEDGYTETVTFRVKKDSTLTPKQFLRIEVKVDGQFKPVRLTPVVATKKR